MTARPVNSAGTARRSSTMTTSASAPSSPSCSPKLTLSASGAAPGNATDGRRRAGHDETHQPDAGALERVEQRPVVDAARHRQRAGELRQRGRQRTLVAGLARDAAGERHRARELAGHLQDLAAHVLHVEQRGAQVVGLGLQRAPLDERRAVRVLGLGDARAAASTTAAAAADAAASAARSASRAAASAAAASRSSPPLPATSASSASCCAREALLLAGQRLPAALQPRRRRQRALALHGEAVERGAALAHRLPRGLQLRRDPRVLGLGRLELARQAALLLRPRSSSRSSGPPGQLGDQPLALGRRRALHLVQQVLPLLGEPAHALEPAVEHAGAQQAPARCARARPASARTPPPRARGRRRPASPSSHVARSPSTPASSSRRACSSASSASTSPVSRRPRVSAISLSTVRSCSAAVAWRRSGASCEPTSRSSSSGALEVAPHLAELELGALAAALVGAQPGGLLDLAAPVLRLAGQERLDLALADDGVQLLAQADLGHQLDDVREPAGRLVDGVLRGAVARHAAHDADLGRRQRQRAVGVVEGELHLGGSAGAAAVAAGEDDVLHGRAAHGGGALLAERPDDGVGEVALAAAVGADDDADAGLEEQLGLLGERLEALEAERLEVHLSRPRWPRRGSPARAGLRRAAGLGVRGFVRAGLRVRLRPARAAAPEARPAGGPPGPRLQLVQRLGRGLLLGALLAGAEPAPQRLAVDDGLDLELAVVRRPAEAEHLVGHRLAAAREVLLQLGLVVDVAALGVQRCAPRTPRPPPGAPPRSRR